MACKQTCTEQCPLSGVDEERRREILANTVEIVIHTSILDDTSPIRDRYTINAVDGATTAFQGRRMPNLPPFADEWNLSLSEARLVLDCGLRRSKGECTSEA